MNGIIVVNKPSGITSRDVVNHISNLLGTKKVGHNGTLDPLASGVLVICYGKYTKLNELLVSKEKEYIAEVTLGAYTDTLDSTGTVLEEREEVLNIDKLKEVIANFPSNYMQEVPMYSAVKVNGKKLYEYAREGKSVVLPKKEVMIHNLELLSYDEHKFTFKALVSKGTYIRSLIRDILKEIGSIGTMSALTRTRQGRFDIKDAYSLEDIDRGNYKSLSIKDVIDIKTVTVDRDLEKKIVNGSKIVGDYPDMVLFLDEKGNELAIYEKDGSFMKVYVMLSN